MPLQKRVTLYGVIVPIPQRGTFIGNRRDHSSRQRALLGKRWTTKAWIVCRLRFKGRQREVMGGRSWTEFFFLDEAIALASADPFLDRVTDAHLATINVTDCPLACISVAA
jgi:hypothetical protein